MKVAACALNRADLMQARGHYPPPPGESEVLGLEAAGVVTEVGEGVAGWEAGDRAMALLAGGGQAEWVAVPVGQLMPVPRGLDLVQAAALPEVALTSWTNLVAEGGLEAGQTVLITGAASGVGTFMTQMAAALGAKVLVAGRNETRLRRLEGLGAAGVCLLGDELPARARELNDGTGVDLVVDLVSGALLDTHLAALRRGGRLVLVGLLGGAAGEIDLRRVLSRRLRLVGSVLRARSRREKAELVSGFLDFAQPLLDEGRLRPVVDRVEPFASLPEAYVAMEEGGVFGKIVLRIDPDLH